MIMLNISQCEHTTFQYLTVAECLRQNGYRHYCNGMKYLEQGLTQHARGSFAKAQRNYDRADILSYDPVFWGEHMDSLARNVAATVIGIDLASGKDRTIKWIEYYDPEAGQIIRNVIYDSDFYNG